MSKMIELPRRVRGDYQTKFKKIEVESNHYHVRIANFNVIYTFKVKFIPSINQDNKTLRNSILQKAMPDIEKMVVNPVISGMTIYSIMRPIKSETESKIT